MLCVCVSSQRRRQKGDSVLGTAAGICQLIVLTFNQFTLQFFPPPSLLLLLLPAKLSKVFADGLHSLSRQQRGGGGEGGRGELRLGVLDLAASNPLMVAKLVLTAHN